MTKILLKVCLGVCLSLVLLTSMAGTYFLAVLWHETSHMADARAVANRSLMRNESMCLLLLDHDALANYKFLYAGNQTKLHDDMRYTEITAGIKGYGLICFMLVVYLTTLILCVAWQCTAKPTIAKQRSSELASEVEQ